MPENRFAGRQRVSIIGASMAGLLAARVLSDYYKHVTIIEKDKLPVTNENRKGVPQGKHTHVLLERGREVMEKYLPGLTEELINLGAVRIKDVSSEVAWYHSGGFHKHGNSDLTGLGVSRPTLENSVRNRVFLISNIEVIDDRSVKGLSFSDDKKRVNGLYYGKVPDDKPGEFIQSDLVVDTTGRGSRSPSWLVQAGYDQPQTEEVKIRMGYVTCYYPRKPEDMPGTNAVIFLADPPSKRMGILLAQDGHRWVVTIGGYLGDHAPLDYPGFLDSVKNLPSKVVYNVIKNKTPLTEPVSYNFLSNLRHRYEKLSHFPEGYLVFGDAICSFNPIYGQGMTVAAMEAEALDRSISENGNNLAADFFNSASKIVDLSWNTAVGGDLSYPEVEGKRTIMTRFLNWYIKKLHTAAHYDADVSVAFLKVINMVASPPSLLAPRIMLRIIRNNLRYDHKQSGGAAYAQTRTV